MSYKVNKNNVIINHSLAKKMRSHHVSLWKRILYVRKKRYYFLLLSRML